MIRVKTVALQGIEANVVDVQVQVAPGISCFQVVGLPEGAVRESRERIRAAFHSMGLSLPAKRITVNLAPANIRKDGSHYDLPIAVGLLCALGVLPQDAADNALFIGELALDGAVAPIIGALPAAIAAQALDLSHIYVPAENGVEAAWAGGVGVWQTPSLKELMHHLKGESQLAQAVAKAKADGARVVQGGVDFKDIKGQETAKLAAEVAAAGGHNLLMIGPPGGGKSMIAQRLPTILPPMTSEEVLQTTMIHSVAGMLDADAGILTQRPFRSPHHSASAVALCGGGMQAKPGEISLSHNGTLFLDELPEFPRQVLETLRQPLETGEVTVSRANHHVTYPAQFQLVAAMNPCPCGYLGHPKKPCTDTPKQVASYQSRISGPLLDRFDMHVNVPVVELADLNMPAPKEGSAEMAARVANARKLQYARFGTSQTNAQMTPSQLDELADITTEARQFLATAGEKLALSARGFHRLLKVARTLADLEAEPQVHKGHVARALSFRSAFETL